MTERLTDRLADLGWSDRFASQLGPDDGPPARVAEVQRDRLTALGPDPLTLLPTGGAGSYAVGDWITHDGARVLRRLDPATEIVRRAAGHTPGKQLIASNVDTLAVVTSCNADFNPARLERYVAIAIAAGCVPLIVLTKADLGDPVPLLRQAEAISPLVTTISLDARDPHDARRLDAWCGPGQTLALVGSSGVGKTTLRNALTGEAAAVQEVREDDAKGRHTTTFRALCRTLAGGALIDTPGMRELRLTEAAEGLAETFGDLADLSKRCRFADCTHGDEPGCAVRAAIEAGTIAPDRLRRFRALEQEERDNSAALHLRQTRVQEKVRRTRMSRERPITTRSLPDDDDED